MTDKPTDDEQFNQFKQLSKGWFGWKNLDDDVNATVKEGDSTDSVSQRKTLAREEVRTATNLPIDAPEWAVNSAIADNLANRREDAVTHFKDNYDQIINGIPEKVLEKRVYDIAPVPIEDKRHDSIAEAHATYMGEKQTVDRYARGEHLDENIENKLRTYAAEKEGKAAEKAAKEKDRSKLVQKLDNIARKHEAYLTLQRPEVAKHCESLVKDAKKNMDEQFSEEYGKVAYARTNLTASTEQVIEQGDKAIMQFIPQVYNLAEAA